MKGYKNLFFVVTFLKKSKVWVIIGVGGMIISSLIAAPIPYLVGYIIDKIILMNKKPIELLKMVALLMLIYIVKYILTLIYQYYFTKVQQTVVNEIRISMISKIIDAPLSFINKTEKGYILGRISESRNIGSLFSPTLLSTFTGVFDLFFSLFVMITLSFKLTIIAIIIMPIYFIISKSSSQKITKSTTNVYENSAILNGEVYETLNGIEDIKLLNGKDTQIKKITIKLRNMVKSIMKQNLNFIRFIQNIVLTNELATALVLLFSGILILKNEITIGIYTSFSIYMTKIFATTQSLGSLEITLKPICVVIERVKEFFELDSENSNECKFLTESIETITFEDVCFKYNEKSGFVINNFNDTIKNGDKVLLSGINGAGKTTLIKLITGLYLPTNGTILINGKDYFTINKKCIRDKIGIVSQNIFLFKGTILENILYGQTKKNKNDVINLINEYNLIEYINRFDKGLNTEIIQNDLGLSGGQTQIVAFLRAIIKKRDIIILDEATSNLDINTRKLILKILKEKKLCNILIIISHQDSELEFINKTINLSA
ncbi:ABC transporter ATP-binding protein [Clostridium sp. DL1XJH146]